MILLVLLLGFILGIIFILSVQYCTLSWIFILSPKAKPPRPLPFSPPSLPEELSQKANGPFREETCQWVNFCGAFLFQELRESNLVKKAVITKLNEEFKEFLLKKTTGQLMNQVTVRDYFLGNSLPQFNSVRVLKVRSDEKEDLLNEVSVGFDVDYKGGALIAIDCNMLLGKTASISVELVRLEGKVRLQFIREPFTHWSISFIRDPILEFRVAPEFQGRTFSQITTIIERLIIRFIKRKHTLPNYKVRRSPLFPKVLPQSANVHVYMQDTSLTEGVLELEILGCSRLLEIPEAKRTFCTAAITNKPWKPLNRLVRPSNGPMLNLTVEKSHGGDCGLSFQRYQDTEMEFNCIVVSEVAPSCPAFKAGVMKGDIVSLINGVEVKSVSKAKSLIESTNSGSFIITVQRIFANHIPATGQLPTLMLEQLNSAPTKQISEYDTEVASLLGGFTPEPAGLDDKETASKHSSIVSEKSDPHSDTSSRGFPEEFPNAELLYQDQHQRTKYKFYSKSIPAFPDKFTFNIMPEHKYLSIVLWYESPVIADAALAGHVTIPLSDISVECIATASGKHKQRYVLVPGNPLIPGMSKTHAKHIAAANDQVSKPWMAPGVANKQAQFAGDILLSFSHTPKSMVREGRPEFAPWNRPIDIAKARQREQERIGDAATEDVQPKLLNAGVTMLEDSGSSYDTLGPEPDTAQTEEGRKESGHSFITLTSFNQSEHDTCKMCYGELGSELVSKCQNCSLVCHHKCTHNAHQKLSCHEKGSIPHPQKVKVPSLEFHTPLEARLSLNGFETNAERVLLAVNPLSSDQDCIADTSRFQDKPLAERLEAYREQIIKMNETLETHDEVIESLKHQLEAPCPPESLQPIKSQLSKTEDKQRAIATLLMQYCEGLKVLETMGESGSEQDD